VDVAEKVRVQSGRRYNTFWVQKFRDNLFCVVLCIFCVKMCTVLLPPGGYPIAVNKYIISLIKIYFVSE